MASSEENPMTQVVQEPEPETIAPNDVPMAEPEPASEPNRQLDLCFMCDATGSMGQYIYAAQKNINAIVDRVVQSEKASVQFALVSYRDHPPQDSSYVTRVFPFTADVGDMQRNVGTMSASGGGDGPEAVTAALHEALHLPWRPNSTKIAVLIADAPPHGLEPTGDGFPNGDPEGRDPLAIAREMAAHGITVYTVGCEPALGGYRFARDFMCTLAEITGGQAVALGSATLLADVIINGSAEEISLTLLQREVDEEIAAVQAAAGAHREVIDEAECARRVGFNLQSRGVTTKQMRTDGKMENSKKKIWHKGPMQSLAAAKAELCAEIGEMNLEDEERCAEPRRMRKKCKATFAAPKESAPGMLSRMLGMGKASRAEEASGSSASSSPTMEFPSSDWAPEEAVSRSVGFAPFARGPRGAPPPPAKFHSAPATMNVLEEGTISTEQVSRMCRKSAMRKA